MTYARRLKLVGAVFATLAMTACGRFDGKADLRWSEAVTLASGEVVSVERHVVMIHERAFGGGFSSAPVYLTSSIRGDQASDAIPLWDAPLVPILIDKDPENGEWIIVASIDGCSMWLRNGMPKPPYWAFRLRDEEWFWDSVPSRFLNRPANLLVEYDVHDDSRRLMKEAMARKQAQSTNPRHAPQYSKVDVSHQKHCGAEALPAGAGSNDAFDLKKFRRLK
jgi:hypothetical protein